MRTVSSYGVELRKQNIPIRQTLDIYRSAVSCLIEIYAQTWDELAVITEPKKRFNTAEHLVHTTKKNQARFDFDLRFPKMPSYLRRAAIQHALGSVSSYKTRLELWEKTDQKGGRPKLVCDNHAMPVFYRDVMYREDTEEKDRACLKLYDGHDWKWFRVSLSHTDMEYLRKNWAGKRATAPVLEKRHRKYFLRFSYTEEVLFTKTPVKEQVICSVDLGLNTDAVCTIMRSDGTVLGRKFIDFPSEKDRMYRVLGRISRFQREHGSAQVKSRWAYAKRLNTELGRKIAGAVTGYAEENHADVIVFEYPEERNRSCTCGEKGISRKDVNIRHIAEGCGFPGSVRGIPADLPVMGRERLPATRAIIVYVHSRMEKDITVIFQRPIILEQDILYGNS